MVQVLKTKLTGLNGLIELTRSERWDMVDYLKHCVSNRQRDLSDYVSKDILKSIQSKEDVFKASKGLPELIGYELCHAPGEFQYRLTLIMSKSVLAKVKTLFKDLLLTTSALDGLRGEGDKGFKDKFYYDLIVDCNNSSNPAQGIHRLARAVYLLETHLNTLK